MVITQVSSRASLLLLACAWIGDASPLYTVVSLGMASANEINSAGQITGQYCFAGRNLCHAFLYSSGTFSDLGATAQKVGGGFRIGDVSTGTAINSSGQIVGNITSSHTAFLYSGGLMTELYAYGIGDANDATAINDSGQITGDICTLSSNACHAALYSGGSVIDLGTLGGMRSEGFGINNTGQITGLAGIPGNVTGHAFLFSNNVMTDLGTFGGTYSKGTAINDAGQVVGVATLAGDTLDHAFLYSDGMMSDLGTLGGTWSEAKAINAAGVIVGFSYTSPTIQHAFIYRNGVMTDLNSLIDPNLGITLNSAQGINASGQIIINNNDGTAYLLNPVVGTPEPNTLLLLTGAMLTPLARRRLWH